MIRYLLALLPLAACATGTVELHPDGTTSVYFWRFGTDTSLEVTSLDGSSLLYSSNPDAVVQQNAQAAMLGAIKLGMGLATGVPVPLSRDEQLRAHEP